MIDPLSQSEYYMYDLNDNLIEKEERNGNVLTFMYDKLNRVTKEEGIDEEDSTKNVTHTFTYYKNGSVKTDSANGVTTTYTYDENNRLMTEADGLGATYTDYLYDHNGNQLTTTVKPVLFCLSYDIARSL